jgi:hypothetical protein
MGAVATKVERWRKASNRMKRALIDIVSNEWKGSHSAKKKRTGLGKYEVERAGLNRERDQDGMRR